MNGKTRLARCVGAALAAAGILAAVGLSRVPWRNPAAEMAELRISWRIPAPTNRRCRPPTEAELEGVLPHMRPSEICTNEAVPFWLDVVVDGDTLRSGPLARAGARARSVTVYERFAIPPGSQGLTVEFRPAAAGRPSRGVLPSPPSDSLAMTLSTDVFVAPGDVILVARGDDGRLEVSGGS